MDNIIKSYHSCFQCNYEFEWEAVLKESPFEARKLAEIRADVYAIGKENNKIKYEMVCACPKCKIKNKFIYE